MRARLYAVALVALALVLLTPGTSAGQAAGLTGQGIGIVKNHTGSQAMFSDVQAFKAGISVKGPWHFREFDAQEGSIFLASVRIQSSLTAEAGLIQIGWIASRGPIAAPLGNHPVFGSCADEGTTLHGYFIEMKAVGVGQPYRCWYIDVPDEDFFGLHTRFIVENRNSQQGNCVTHPCEWTAKIGLPNSPPSEEFCLAGLETVPGTCDLEFDLGFDWGYAMIVNEYTADAQLLPCRQRADFGTENAAGLDPNSSIQFRRKNAGSLSHVRAMAFEHATPISNMSLETTDFAYSGSYSYAGIDVKNDNPDFDQFCADVWPEGVGPSGSGPYEEAVLEETNLVNYYKLDEASGLPQDSGPAGWDATGSNGTPQHDVEGPFFDQGAIRYAAGSSHVAFHPTQSIGDECMAMEGWVRLNAVGTVNTYIFNAINWAIRVTSDRRMGLFRQGTGDVGLTTDSQLTVGDWTHFFVRRDVTTGDMHFFLDGEEDANSPLLSSAIPTPYSFNYFGSVTSDGVPGGASVDLSNLAAYRGCPNPSNHFPVP